MNAWLEAIILGAVQGITEWLPVSSSAHLVLFEEFFNIKQPLIYEIVLHLGSLLALLVFFRKEIKELVVGILNKEKEALRFLGYLIIGTIPIGIVGYFLNDLIKASFHDLRFTGICLVISALLLFLSKYPTQKDQDLTWKGSIIIGIAQAFSLFTGISRSGSTISIGLLQGIKKQTVAKYSFFLFIPAIIGATVLEIGNINQITGFPTLLLGTFIAFLAGIASLKLLLYTIKNTKLGYYAWYCLILGFILIVWGYL